MASPTIKVKRSSVFGKIPTPTQLDLGELAINTFDGKVYTERDRSSVGIGTTVIIINPWSVGTGTNTYNTFFTDGNVGVGSTLPTSRFHVIGNSVFVGVTTINGLKFPSNDGTNGQVLQTDGFGNLSFGTASGGSSVPTEENFTATQNQTIFTTTTNFTVANYISVFLNGVKMRRTSDFTTTTPNTVTFTSGLKVNDEVDIVIN